MKSSPSNPHNSSPNLIQLPTGLPIGTVNVWFFETPVPTLIDTGLKSDSSLQALEQGLAKYGYRIGDLERIFISHEHVDHFGLAATLTKLSRATLFVFEPTVPALVNYSDYWNHRITFFRRQLFPKLGFSEQVLLPLVEYYDDVKNLADELPADRVQPFGVGEGFEWGNQSWQVLHTPGHCVQLTCFYQPDTRQFISTDMLLSQTPTPIIDPPTTPDQDYLPALPAFLRSLEKIAALDIDFVYPGHGEPFEDAHTLIRRQQSRIARRKNECLTYVQSGISTIEPILLAMYPHYPPRYRFAALWMLLGYLDLLCDAGDVIRVERSGVWHYLPA